MSTTPFTALLSSSRSIDGGLAIDVPADWAQGRSIFGGLQAAFAVRAMRALVDPAIPLRSLQVTFVGPAAGTLRATASVLRTGSSVTQLEARVMGPDGIATIVVGVFGKPRTSTAALVPQQPAIDRPARPFEMKYVPGLFPAFLQHFNARWLRGKPPFSGSTDPVQIVEIDLLDDGAPGEAHAIAAADFPPPIGLTFLRAPANGSTITWMLELLTDRFVAPNNWRIDAELLGARDGYTNQTLTVWAADGTPIALGHQSMMVFG